jgi:hypothetical protein
MIYVDVGVLFCYHLDISVLFNADIGILPRLHLVFLMIHRRLMAPSRTLHHQLAIIVSHLAPPGLHMHPPQVSAHLEYVTLVPGDRNDTELVDFEGSCVQGKGAGAGAIAG